MSTVFSSVTAVGVPHGLSSPGLSGTLYADIDPVSDQVILAGNSDNKLVSIDLVTHVRCELDANTGRQSSGTIFSGIAIDSGTGTAYISEAIFPSSVYSYDLSTGSMSRTAKSLACGPALKIPVTKNSPNLIHSPMLK